MTNYRQSMADALEFMNIMREYRILERDLTDTEKKRREEIAQDMDDGDFKDRYGDRWKEVKMATATKQAKKESGDGPLSTVDEAAYYMPKGRELKALKKLMSQPTVPIGNMDSEDNILAKGQLPIGDKELDKELEDLYDKKGSKGDAKSIIKKAMKRLGIKEEVELDEALSGDVKKWFAKKGLKGIKVRTVSGKNPFMQVSRGSNDKIPNDIIKKAITLQYDKVPGSVGDPDNIEYGFTRVHYIMPFYALSSCTSRVVISLSGLYSASRLLRMLFSRLVSSTIA